MMLARLLAGVGLVFYGWGLTTRCLAAEPTPAMHWNRLASLPDLHGFAGMYAGVSNRAMLAAGGANFPKGLPWDGGSKVWHDRIFVALPGAEWRLTSETLPRPLAYGVVATFNDELICVGGETSTANSGGSEYRADVFSLRWTGMAVERKDLPQLPFPMANACGAIVDGQRLYIAGGAGSPSATGTLNTLLALELGETSADRKWKTLEGWPGPPRMLAVAAAWDGRFYLFSGTDLAAGDDGKPIRRYLRDAFCFDEVTGWKRIADLPRAAVAAPSPAPVIDGCILILGGDDGAQVHLPPQDRTGFPDGIVSYDPVIDQWSEAGHTPASRVTVPTVQVGSRWRIVSGERRPGVRSPEVWELSPASASP